MLQATVKVRLSSARLQSPLLLVPIAARVSTSSQVPSLQARMSLPLHPPTLRATLQSSLSASLLQLQSSLPPSPPLHTTTGRRCSNGRPDSKSTISASTSTATKRASALLLIHRYWQDRRCSRAQELSCPPASHTSGALSCPPISTLGTGSKTLTSTARAHCTAHLPFNTQKARPLRSLRRSC